MKVLIVSRYKAQYANHVLPFVAEQFVALKDAGCEVELFLLRGNYWKQWNALRAKIREFKPDILHAHYGLSCLVSNLATRRVPVVSTYHGSDINEPKVLPFSRVAMRLSAWNIFVSKRNMALAGAVEGKKCSLLPCGVALSDDQLMTRAEVRAKLAERGKWNVEGGKKVLFAGAFDNPVKEPELAKRAIDDFKLQIADLELIELKGYSRNEINMLMCAVDCLLMTSKTEGSPQVIKEAMACGCPIVSVDVGDVAERIEGVEGCYIVKSREPRAIATATEKALAFKGKTKGRERIMEDGLSNEQVAEKIINIYKQLVKH